MGSNQATIHYKCDKAKRIFRELETLASLKAEAFIAGKHPDRDKSLAEIAAYHEYGTSRMPARPIMRTALHGSAFVQAVVKTEISSIIRSNRTGLTAIRRVAQAKAKLVVEAIDTSPGWATPLSPHTIEKKGHDFPLVDKGAMRAGVQWGVSKDGVRIESGPAVKV